MTDDYEKEKRLLDDIVEVSHVIVRIIGSGEAKTSYQLKDLAVTVDHLISAYTNLHECIYGDRGL